MLVLREIYMRIPPHNRLERLRGDIGTAGEEVVTKVDMRNIVVRKIKDLTAFPSPDTSH